MEEYKTEIQGQIDFYKRFNLENDIKFVVNSDGVYNGVLFENKLQINDVGKVILQLIKYASKIRLLGMLLPEKLIANDLNNERAYIINSVDFLDEIEKIYLIASSRENEGFVIDSSLITEVDYSDSKGVSKLLNIINEAGYTKYNVDFNNIVALSRVYYKINPDKDAFIMGRECEIRKPKILADRILPYKKYDNLEFSRIMDQLNSKLAQIELGAFYTPVEYAKLSQKLLLDKIEELKKINKEYIIIDRCAGSGQLYEGLPDEILNRCVLSTIEPNEYLILQEKFSNKSTVVVPPTDAMMYDIIPTETDAFGNVINDYIRDKINDPDCAIIMYENPPFSEAGGKTLKKIKDKELKKLVKTKITSWKNSFVANEMDKKVKGATKNDLSSLFIWSAFEYYLKKPFDSYIVYAPLKYWNRQHLVNKEVKDGFICNRKHFHASEFALTCIRFDNIDKNVEELKFDAFNINKERDVVKEATVKCKKSHYLLSRNYDKRKFEDDILDEDYCKLNGYIFDDDKSRIRLKSYHNDNILGYMKVESFNTDGASVCLIRKAIYNGNGFYLRKDNFIEKLPMFCAGLSNKYLQWYQKGVVCKTYDGKGFYIKDKDFLKKCFIYSCLTSENKVRSLYGLTGNFYKNDLCFDNNAYAREVLNSFELTEEEKTLIKMYDDILDYIKKLPEYNPEFTYGLYQIIQDINIDDLNSYTVKKNKKKSYNKKYPLLNNNIKGLKLKLTNYYKNNILQDLFKYELLK